YGFSILRVFDLNSGQVVATWAMECPDGSGIQPPADGIWLRDVDGDGRDEILCNLLTGDRVPAGVALLRYDSALGVITPGPRSSGPAELKAVPNPARRSVMISFNMPKPDLSLSFHLRRAPLVAPFQSASSYLPPWTFASASSTSKAVGSLIS